MAYIKFYPLGIEYFERGRVARATYPGVDKEFDKMVIRRLEKEGYRLRHTQWQVHTGGAWRVLVFSKAK